MKAQAKALATYNPTTAKKTLTDDGFTYKGSQLLDPKGNPVNLDIHVISGWSDWVASDQIIAKNLQAIGIDSREARAGLELVVSERIAHEEPDAALAGRRPGLAVRLLQRQLPQQLVHRVRSGRHEHRQLGALQERPGDGAAQPVEATLDPKKQQAIATAAREAVAAAASDRAAVRRPAVVDLQHAVLPLLRLTEEPLRRSDLHDVPRQPSLIHADLPRRQGRAMT